MPTLGLAVTLGLVATLSACGASGDASNGGHQAGQASGGLPSAHVHGVDVDPADGLVYLATHEGLFRYDVSGPRQVGPTIDLMGFAVAAPHALAASPTGKVVVATAPTGPVRSTDGGRTWAPSADAPPLMVINWASGDTVAGVTPEGEVAISTDAGLTWQLRAELKAQPHAVGAELTDGGKPRLLVVTDDAIRESTDGGTTFTKLPGSGS
jgi:hypothetical protein